MKSITILIILILSFSSYAQIKVFSGGSVTIGATTAPYGVTHQIIGDKVAFSATSGSISSAPLIIGQNASSVSPAFTFWGDHQTGIAHPSSSVIGITISNSEKFRFNSSGQILCSTANTSASSPAYSWSVDASTGIFRPGSQTIGFTINGSEAMRISSYKNLLLGTTGEWDSRLVCNAESNKVAITSISTHTADYGYCQANYVNRNFTKAFAVINGATGSYVETYHVMGSGDVWAKSTTHWSDKNLKENIDSLQNSLNKIKQLKGVKYNFKASFVGNGPIKTEIGLIAQDVEQIIPEVVNTNENGMKGIVYHNLIPVLIEAIKELDAKNTKLENDLSACCSIKNNGTTNRTIQSSNTDSQTENQNSWLAQNKPNPFNKETIIEYNIVEQGNANILIFDMSGKLLKTLPVKIPGKGSVIISANDLIAGMYYYTLVVNDNEVDTKKMILTQ